MTCHEFTDRLPDRLDGTLARRAAAALRRHARNCAAYEVEYRNTVAVLRELAEWPVDGRHEETACPAALTRLVPWLEE